MTYVQTPRPRSLKPLLIACMICAMGLIAQAAQAQTEQLRLEARLGVVKIGTFHITAQQTQTRYSIDALLTPAKLTGLLVRLRYRAHANGTVQNHNLRPALYTENQHTGQRQSHSRIRYQKARPHVELYEPDTPLSVNLADQTDTVDPLTALYTVLRDSQTPCNQTLFLFDGRRRSALTLGAFDGTSCTARYTRLQGYTPQEMQDRQTFDATLRFDKQGDIYRLQRISVQTLFGMAQLRRR